MIISLRSFKYPFLILFFILSGHVLLKAQTYPFVDGFESYSNFSSLGTQGGYMSDMSVYSTHGMGNSWKGLIAQMTNFNLRDTTVSPLIGPFTAASQLSFFYRVMQTGGLYPYVPASMLAGDSILVYLGSQSLNNYQLVHAITSANLVQDTSFKKVKVTLPGALAGQSGNIKIVTRHTANSNDFFVDIDSLSIRDSVAGPAPLTVSKQSNNASCYGKCDGNVTLTPGGGLGGYSVNWSNSLGSGLSKNNLCTGTYRFTVTDASGSLVDSVTITSPAQIVVNLIADSLQFCPSDSVQICATTGFASYQWNVTNSNSNCVYMKNAGNCAVTVTDNQNCTEVKQISVTVFSVPSISISVNGDTLVTFSGNTYQWYLNDNPITGANDQIYIASVSGSYSVEITDDNGCHAKSVAIQVNVTGIDEFPVDEGFSLLPNVVTSNSDCMIRFKDYMMGGLLRIFDVSGQVVQGAIVNESEMQVNPKLGKGIYMVTIESGHRYATRRLVRL